MPWLFLLGTSQGSPGVKMGTVPDFLVLNSRSHYSVTMGQVTFALLSSDANGNNK